MRMDFLLDEWREADILVYLRQASYLSLTRYPLNSILNKTY